MVEVSYEDPKSVRADQDPAEDPVIRLAGRGPLQCADVKEVILLDETPTHWIGRVLGSGERSAPLQWPKFAWKVA